jgi:hypothetical protein
MSLTKLSLARNEKKSTKSDHVYYTLKIFENFMFLEDEKRPVGTWWVKLFPASESLVGEIPAGDEKIAHLFLQCSVCDICFSLSLF